MEAVLEATARETIGKNEARRTRRSGQVPGVLYGSPGGDGNKDPRPIAVDPKALLKILHSESGANTLISLKLAGEGNSRVLVTVSEHDHSAEVKVQDWGTGIAESELAHIFERFHRADVSRTRETGGYGLGLAITKAMVSAYRGTIVAESRVGEGTVMTVRLPLEA